MNKRNRTLFALLTLVVCTAGVGCSGAVPIQGPRNLTARVMDTGQVQLAWDAVLSPASEILVEYRTKGARFQRLASLALTDVAYAAKMPTDMTTSYRVLAFTDDDPATGTYSKEVALAQ